MKKMISMILTLLLCVFFSSGALAADATLSWESVDNAIGYKLYQSIDYGVTWSEPLNVTDTPVEATYMVIEKAITNVPESGVVLFKVSAYNENHETVSHWQGAWFNYQWLPIDPPTGLGVQ